MKSSETLWRNSLLVSAMIVALALGGVSPAAASAPLVKPASVTSVGPEVEVDQSGQDLLMSPDGTTAYVADARGLSVFDVSTLRRVGSIGSSGSFGRFVISPDGLKLYASNTFDGGISVISTQTKSVTAQFSPTQNRTRVELAISPDGGTLLALANYPRSLFVLDATTGAVVNTVILDPQLQAERVWMSPDGREAYISMVGPFDAKGQRAFTVKVVDIATGKLVRTIDACSYVRTILFIPSGTKAYVGCESGVVSVVATATGAVTKTLAPGMKVNFSTLAAQGTKLLVAGYESTRVTEIDVATDTETGFVEGRSNIAGLAAAKSGRQALMLRNGYPGSYSIPGSSGNSALSYMTVTNVKPSVSIDRIAGADRYETAVAASRAEFWGSNTVYVASGEDFPDALAAGPAALAERAPLLLTKTKVLPAAVQDEILRLKPNKVVVVGGSGAVSASVFQQLKALVPNTIRRAGADRYATARAVVAGAFPTVGSISLVTGADYPDALSAPGPVLLVPPGTKRLDTPTMSLLIKLKVFQVEIIGGPGVVGTALEAPLKAQFIQVYRYGGSDRFETNRLVNQSAVKFADRSYFASGYNFPDALAISAISRARNAVVYLVRQNCVPARTSRDLAGTNAATRITLLGGPAVTGNEITLGTKC